MYCAVLMLFCPGAFLFPSRSLVLFSSTCCVREAASGLGYDVKASGYTRHANKTLTLFCEFLSRFPDTVVRCLWLHLHVSEDAEEQNPSILCKSSGFTIQQEVKGTTLWGLLYFKTGVLLPTGVGISVFATACRLVLGTSQRPVQ